jgi:hypothetical protein
VTGGWATGKRVRADVRRRANARQKKRHLTDRVTPDRVTPRSEIRGRRGDLNLRAEEEGVEVSLYAPSSMEGARSVSELPTPTPLLGSGYDPPTCSAG